MDDDLDGSDAGDSGPPDGEGLDDNDALEFQHFSSVVPDLLVDRSERELLTSQLDLRWSGDKSVLPDYYGETEGTCGFGTKTIEREFPSFSQEPNRVMG
jgi:hypothetical protein